jgi:pantoate--beta-alanine ligase
MKTILSIDPLKNELKKLREQNRSIGFVPTMGFLHEGHLSLVRESKKENDRTVVSIFVNPAQFAPHEDFDSYPRDMKKDSEMLEEMGVDILFCPAAAEIYPGGYATYVEVEKLGNVLCGKSRENHFRGVTTVVLKLFNIVGPTRAYFGRKDAQQAIIIKKMVTDLNLDVVIRTAPIARDVDGLALSSRNVYLSAEERKAALQMPAALQRAKAKIDEGFRDALAVKKMIREELKKNPSIEIDYVEVASLDRLEDAVVINPGNTLVAAAIRVGKTRLIDNFILGEI